MNIVNAHAHMIELEAMVQQNPDVEISLELDVFKHLDETLPLLKPKKLLEQMEEAGVNQTILYACLCPFIYSSNEYVARLCQKYPDKLTGFASVLPLEKNAPEQLEYYVKKLGLKGLKFHPPLQHFYPDDKRVFPVYEKAAELNIPVVFHVGTTPFGPACSLDQAHPLLIDAVACRFPGLRIMLTHLGTLWHNEAFMVVEKNPNVYIDTAAYLYEIEELLTPDLITRIGEDKIIFGTDFPMPFGDRPHRLKDFTRCIKELPIADHIKEKIFSKNIHSLLYGKKNRTVPISYLLEKGKEYGVV